MDGWMGWMRAAERYGDLQGLNKAETTNKYGEEKVGPALYKKLFFFWACWDVESFHNSGHLVGPVEAAEATKKKTRWLNGVVLMPFHLLPSRWDSLPWNTGGGAGGMLKDSCQRVILAGETFEGFVAVETKDFKVF